MFRAIGSVVSSRRINSGLVFEIVTQDHNGQDFSYGLAINSSMGVAREVAYSKLADLCRACGKTVIQDTSELHDISFIVEYDNAFNILQLAPLHVTIERTVKPLWVRLWERLG